MLLRPGHQRLRGQDEGSAWPTLQFELRRGFPAVACCFPLSLGGFHFFVRFGGCFKTQLPRIGSRSQVYFFQGHLLEVWLPSWWFGLVVWTGRTFPIWFEMELLNFPHHQSTDEVLPDVCPRSSAIPWLHRVVFSPQQLQALGSQPR